MNSATSESNDSYYLSLAVQLLTDVLTYADNVDDPGWQHAAEAAVLGCQSWLAAHAPTTEQPQTEITEIEMTEDEASQVVVNNLKAMGYQPPSPHMRKRVDAALGVSVPLWFRASKPRQEEVIMQMHRALEAADAVGPDA